MRSALLLALCLAPALACASRGEPDPSAPSRGLDGTTWRLVRMEGAEVPAEPPSTLIFEGERLAGDGGVNRFFGTVEYALDGRFETGALASTRRAGPPELMDREQRYLSLLEQVESMRFVEGRLELLAAERVLLVLEQVR
jgi:heat shock protein HslJ